MSRPEQPSRVRDLVVLLSLANLANLSVWRELVFADSADAYWLPAYTRASHLASVFNVLLVASVLWLLSVWVRKSESTLLDVVARLAFLGLLVFPLQYLRKAFRIDVTLLQWARETPWLSVPVALVVAFALVALLVKKLQAVTRVVAFLLLLLAPFLLWTVPRAAWRAIDAPTEPEAISKPARPTSRESPGPRVVWLMFDELDLRLAFTEPPERVDLPAFRRVTENALFATNAESHSMATEEAVPSYLLGRLVGHARPFSKEVLMVQFANEPARSPHAMAPSDTVFHWLASSGDRVAIVGYYHPYCRLFADSVDACRSFAFGTFDVEATSSIPREMLKQLFAVTPVGPRLGAIHTFEEGAGTAASFAADSSFDLVYAHASVPHGPNLFDEETGELTLWNTERDGYFGNLVLADRFLAQVRSSMSEADLWDDAAVLITSDHEWRFVNNYDNRRVAKVPFILKMPGQTNALTYERSFTPMVVVPRLLEALRAGELRTAAEVASWLDDADGSTPASARSP